jgi:hypothetical protein
MEVKYETRIQTAQMKFLCGVARYTRVNQKISQIESVTKYSLLLLLVIVVTFKVVPFQVYAAGPAFLPLPEMTFGNCM